MTLTEAKRQCGIADDVSFHDAQLSALIAAARETVEHDTGLVCYTGSHTYKLTQFPCEEWFELPLRPVTAITSITYVDTAGATQTWSSASYALETSGVIPYVRLAYGQSWPTLRGDINGITVTLVAGYASVLAVPQMVKHAVLLKLFELWQTDNEMDPANTATGYERLVARLMRSSYP